MKLIYKDKLVAEIEKRKKEAESNCGGYKSYDEHRCDACIVGFYEEFLEIINTLETKEVEEKFDCPTVKIQDAIEVYSRMKYIDDDLKPIAEFIMNYASWNLHKDEWNQPVLEVPLFRVLDALVQRGKPYCCS